MCRPHEADGPPSLPAGARDQQAEERVLSGVKTSELAGRLEEETCLPGQEERLGRSRLCSPFRANRLQKSHGFIKYVSKINPSKHEGGKVSTKRSRKRMRNSK